MVFSCIFMHIYVHIFHVFFSLVSRDFRNGTSKLEDSETTATGAAKHSVSEACRLMSGKVDPLGFRNPGICSGGEMFLDGFP